MASSMDSSVNSSSAASAASFTLGDLVRSSRNIALLPVGELQHLLETHDAGLFDVRSIEEFDSGHLKNTHSLSFAAILIRRFARTGMTKQKSLAEFIIGNNPVKELVTSEKPVVLYDKSSTTDSPLAETSPLRVFSYYFAITENRPVYIIDGGYAAIRAEMPADTEMTQFGQFLTAQVQQRSPPTTPIMQQSNLNFVDDFVAVGSEADAHNLALLKTHGVTHLLNLTPTPSNPEVVAAIRTLQIPLMDSHKQDILGILEQALAFIAEARSAPNGRILVHCFAGISRSGSIAIAYQMVSKGVSFREAYAIVTQHRARVEPNLNFCGQLVTFEQAMRLDAPLALRPTIAEACRAAQRILQGTTVANAT
jgi:dual specificity MAP kinase phosphatase